VIPGSSAAATYNTTDYGDPRQVALIEAPVAIAVNVNGFTTNNSQSSSGAGSAMQLTTAQVCAIFAGEVKDWSSAAAIAALNSSGTAITQLFYAANIGSGMGASTNVATQYYSSTSPTTLPIHLVYRSDGSGTSFIITNYLKSVCPQLGNATNKYTDIFTSGLPSTDFGVLKTNITNAFTMGGVGAARVADWIGVSGSDAVAQAINNVASSGGTTYSGRIGYLSVDFTQPYQTGSYYPLSAAVQNEALRVAGTLLPASTSGGSNLPTSSGRHRMVPIWRSPA
jgi:ABC-type phosphate transport system substrate-binding protein